jgi:hypothetical protein
MTHATFTVDLCCSFEDSLIIEVFFYNAETPIPVPFLLDDGELLAPNDGGVHGFTASTHLAGQVVSRHNLRGFGPHGCHGSERIHCYELFISIKR